MSEPSNAGGVYAGVDVGGTKTAAVLINAQGSIAGRGRRATMPGPAGVVDSIVAVIEDAYQDGDVVEPLRGVGVGVPGAVDPNLGIVAHAVNIGLDEFPLSSTLRDVLKVPTRVDNDVTLAALGLSQSRAEASSLAFINLGTGFGVGVVIDGTLLRGRRGAAGEIGHLPFDPRGRRCQCGLVGCLELSASGGALARAAGTRSVPQLFADAGRGDFSSTVAVEEFCAALALGIRMVVQAYDVDIVALGGGVFASSELFMPRVLEIIAAQCRDSIFVRNLHIADRIQLVDEAVQYAALGAAHNAKWLRQ